MIMISSSSIADSTAMRGRAAPRAKGYPAVGVLLHLLLNPPKFLVQTARSHPGELVALDLGLATVYLVSAPAHVQHVLIDNWRNYDKGEMLRPLKRLLGDGLVTSEGESWFQSRRLMQPLFSTKEVGKLVDTMAEVTASELDALTATLGRPIEMSREMMSLTQAIMMRTMFGTALDRQQFSAMVDALHKALAVINFRMFLYFLPSWLPMPGEMALRKAIDQVDSALLPLVRERRRSGGSRADLLDLLLESRDAESETGMNDQQLRDECVTMFIAGHETTGSALTWLWYLLDEHPAVEERLRQEIRAVLGDRRPTRADLGRLHYTQMVVQECLRLYPVGWLFPRVARAADTIDGYSLPAGATLLISPYVTQRMPELWKRPDVFDPERFAPEQPAGRHRCAYFPFGGGPRQCIGNHFAMMEMQIIVTMMLQRCRPRRRSRGPAEPMAAMTIRPRHGLPMTLERV
jgi:cytochrome P450